MLGIVAGQIDGRARKINLSLAAVETPKPPKPPVPGPNPNPEPRPEDGGGTRPPAPPPPPTPPHPSPSPQPETPSASAFVPTAKDKLKAGHITLQEALDQHTFQIATFLDARNADEFKAGHIAGAHFCPLSELRANRPPAVLATLPKESPIIIYCGGGDCEASEDVAILLQSGGFLQVFVLHDGYPGWAAMKYPTQTGAPTP